MSKFRRGFWRAERLFEPHPVLANACVESAPHYVVDISEMTLPQLKTKDLKDTPAIPQGGVCLPRVENPQMDWRYNAVIGSLGPANNGSFTEFDTEELINRRDGTLLISVYRLNLRKNSMPAPEMITSTSVAGIGASICEKRILSIPK